ncbi:MAG: 3-phosphoshikimate 1-carboxyvinyltransferase [Gemmatimonadetes bacterium]|nr:3-phosphoshikimate 1-carboxyvinyltransferase [Gemmatimonadota bacterium]MBK9692807.1 3-phosphoshikimate 1-carboxyvinyltransferase [Gemmatimonadota bacterium]
MRVRGTIRVPGDKSLSHRALLFAAMARGTSHIGGLLTSLDARSSARVLRQLGAEISPLGAGRVVTVTGRGRLRRPAAVLNCGNSGTTTRLMLGLLAGHSFRASLTGDASLRRRPMRRVTAPLAQMGATIYEQNDMGTLPLAIKGGVLAALRHEMPVSSAQIKGCLLLAGVVGGVPVSVREPHGRSRDHTERLLRAFGYQVDEQEGWVHFRPTGQVVPFDMQVPGDPSSAAFPVAAAILAEGGELRLGGVCVNPTRIGFLSVLERMGARVDQEGVEPAFDEPVGDLVARPAALRATEVLPGEIPGLIDEVPMLACLATRASGTTIFREVGELRVKESDRLALIAGNIRAVGGTAEIHGDDLHVTGGDRPPVGKVVTEGDHRIAMAFAVLGTVPGAKIRVDDMACAAVSYPEFPAMLRAIRG